MRGILTSLLIWTTTAATAQAGAWLRDPGSLFIAATTTTRLSPTEITTEGALYAEYGLRPKLTLGLDINHKIGYSGHALTFVRYPIGPRDRRNRYAVELGLGGHHWQGDWSPMAKLAVSMGRGLEFRRGNGWLAVDAAIEQRFGNPDPLYKLDATLGLPLWGRIGPMLQVETAKTRDLPLFWSVTPGLRYETKKLGTFVVGYESKHGIESTHGIKFGLWRDF